MGDQLSSLLGAFPFQRDPERYTPMSRPLRMKPYLENRFDYEFYHIRPTTNFNYYLDYGTTFAKLIGKLRGREYDGILVWNYYYLPVITGRRETKIADITDITRRITHNRMVKGMTVDLVEKRFMPGLDLIIVQVKEKLEEYRTRYADPIVRYVPNGVDTELFQPDPASQKEYDFCFLGKIERQYHIRELVGGIALSGASALFVGGGRSIDEFREYSKERGANIDFTGLVPHEEVPRRLNRCRFGLQPTKHGGPLKLYEYLACGLPVISREVVDPDIRQGVHLATEGTEEEYSRIMSKLKDMGDSDYTSASQACREESLGFSLYAMGEKYCDAIAEVI